jgi:hypothetical protein
VRIALAFRAAVLAAFVTLSLRAEPRHDSDPAPSSAQTKSKKQKKKKQKKRKKHESRKKAPSRRKPTPSGLSLRGESGVEVGYAHGLALYPFDAGTTLSRLRLVPEFRTPALTVRVPLGLRHQYFWDQPLSETRLKGDVEAELKATRAIHPFAGAGALLVLRPTWPDLYQPVDGDYLHTGRFSYFERELALGSELNVGRGSELEVQYRFARRTYQQDPAFEPIERPNHLAPGDRDEHRIGLQWTRRSKPIRLRAAAAGFERDYFFWFARDAGTGLTHAGPGGAPPNPLYQVRGLVSGIDLRWDVSSRVSVSPEYELELIDDTYQGYYSSVSHQPALKIEAQPGERFGIEGAIGVALRRFGQNSYAAGPSHPPLTSGDRRSDQRFFASVRARYAWFDGVALTLSAGLLIRRTNFPPYQAGVFPASGIYDIPWNYDNARILFGCEYLF